MVPPLFHPTSPPVKLLPLLLTEPVAKELLIVPAFCPTSPPTLANWPPLTVSVA
jgi:hypothetical protein